MTEHAVYAMLARTNVVVVINGKKLFVRLLNKELSRKLKLFKIFIVLFYFT